MPGTVTADLTTISLCESPFTGWTNVGTGTAGLNDPTVFDSIQGAYCYQDYRASLGARGQQWDFGASTPADFRGKILICWMAFSKKNFGANPMRFRLTDTAGNWSEWNMFTQADLPHPAWIPWALNPEVPRDAGVGTLDLSSIRYFSWRCDAVAAKVYIYWDAVRYGYGLSIKGGTAEDPAKFEDFYDADRDNANAYGIVEKYNGVYFVQGQLKIGSLVANESTYFKDTNQVIQFKSMKGNPVEFYEIKGQRAKTGTGTTRIFFGEKSGTAGVAGCFIRAPAEMRWKLTMTDTNITEFGFYGCTFVSGVVEGQAYSESKEFLNTSFIACAEIVPDTGIVKYCNIISAINRGIRISSADHKFSDSTIISCFVGVRFDTALNPVPLVNVVFTGNTYDVENTSSGLVHIDCSGTTNAATKYENPGPIEIDNPKTLTLTGLPDNTEVTMVRVSDGHEMWHLESSSGDVVIPYGPEDIGEIVDILMVHINYDPHLGQIYNYSLPATDTILPVQLILDPTYYNP